MTKRAIAIPEKISDDTPIRLETAAAIAFPDGSMTASGLRREAERERLVIERVAGKDYTTLNHIKRMRELCRVRSNRQDSGNGQSVETKTADSHMLPPGLSSMEVANSALDSTLSTLMERTARSRITSTGNTRKRRQARRAG